MPFAAHRPAPDVEQAINQDQRAMNASRFIPRTPELYKQISEQNRVFIFNVGPWMHRRDLGSAGSYLVKACPEGKPYSEPLIIPGVVEEPYPINEAECKVMTDTGRNLALQVLGEGPFIPRDSSFTPYGVFLSDTEEPSPAALAKANQELQKKFNALVKEASDAYAKGPKAFEDVYNVSFHLVAAWRLKKTVAECGWLAHTSEPAARENCPGCGEAYNVGIVRHGCGWIFDRKKWEENQAAAKAK